MASRSDFTPEEWAQVERSPMMASIAVVAASPSGPFGVLKEVFAVAKLIAESKAKGGASPLVDAVVADITTKEGMERAKPTDLKGMSPEQARAHAMDALKRVAELVDRKAPADAPAFKQWLQDVALRVANAAKEGGFLGIGGTLVSKGEQAALEQLSQMLGVSVPDTSHS